MMEKPNWEKIVRRRKASQNRAPNLGLYAFHTETDQFSLDTDEAGRCFATLKVAPARLKLRWELICRDFGYTIPLLDEDRLDEFQRRIRDLLATGRHNAILYGKSGSGKTTVAMWALRELHLAERTVKAVRMLDFKTQMEPRYCEENKVSPDTVGNLYREPEFLLIDELGYGEQHREITEHERRIFFDLVSVRDSTGKKTWVSSNTSRPQLHELYGEAAFSRLDATGWCVVGDFTDRPNYRYEAK